MHVEYHPIGGGSEGTAMTTGVIQRVLSHDEFTGSVERKIHADESHPRYLILNDHTQKETAYKRDNIVRVLEE